MAPFTPVSLGGYCAGSNVIAALVIGTALPYDVLIAEPEKDASPEVGADEEPF